MTAGFCTEKDALFECQAAVICSAVWSQLCNSCWSWYGFCFIRNTLHKEEVSDVAGTHKRRGTYWFYLIFQVVTASSMKMAAIWDLVPCSQVVIDWCFRGAYCLIIRVITVWNMSVSIRDYMVQHPRRQPSSILFFHNIKHLSYNLVHQLT
jgi:hypothetical protein